MATTRGTTLRTLICAVVAATALPASAEATGPAPTLVAETTVAGVRTPAPLVHGGWTHADGVWTAELATAAPPGGRTVVTSTWRSPKVSAANGAHFAYATSIRQQDVEGRYTGQAAVRICTTKGCERWFRIGVTDVPPSHTSMPGYVVEIGRGMSITVEPVRRAVWFEWTYRHEQVASYGETTVHVAVGRAAQRLGVGRPRLRRDGAGELPPQRVEEHRVHA